jgi:hypothetical protein
MSRANGDNLHCFVRLWLVVGKNRGMGATVCSGHATEEEATAAAQGGHEYVEWVDIPWSVLESLKPNSALDETAVISSGFLEAFRNCPGITSIPADLFRYNTKNQHYAGIERPIMPQKEVTNG